MRIGIFTDTYYPEVNGVSKSCNTLFNILKEKGHEVYVFCTGKYTFFDRGNHIYRIHGLYLKQLYGYRLVSPLRSKIYKDIKKLNLDVIHINTEYGVGLIGIHASKKFNIPITYTYHTNVFDYTYYVTKGIFDNEFQIVVNRLLKKCFYYVDELIVPSEDTKNKLIEKGVNKFMNVIPTGIDFSSFKEDTKDSKKSLEIKKTLQISPENKILLYLGRVAKEKSIDKLINYYAKFLSETKNYNTKFVIVGDGPNRSDLEKLAKKLKIEKNVVFVGKVNLDDVKYYYHIADVFLNASESETQGLTYLEAIASKVPLLVKKADYLKCVVIDSKTGFLFENYEDFAQKLELILNFSSEEKDKIINEAYKIIDRFSVETFYENIIYVYNRALKDRY